MNKDKIKSLAVKKTDKKDKVMSVKVSTRSYDILVKNNIDIAKTIQSMIDYLAESL